MGMTKVNNRAIATPVASMKVADLKELGGIPRHEDLYDLSSGRVLHDEETVPTDEHEYGAVTEWERGANRG